MQYHTDIEHFYIHIHRNKYFQLNIKMRKHLHHSLSKILQLICFYSAVMPHLIHKILDHANINRYDYDRNLVHKLVPCWNDINILFFIRSNQQGSRFATDRVFLEQEKVSLKAVHVKSQAIFFIFLFF
jgi:hypothetical protein